MVFYWNMLEPYHCGSQINVVYLTNLDIQTNKGKESLAFQAKACATTLPCLIVRMRERETPQGANIN